MAYKRQIDRLPIIPTDAKKHNVVCGYCIVGCGYHAYTWPMNREGGARPEQNAMGTDLSVQQGVGSDSWYAPSMYNVVRQNGRDVHVVVKPDHQCAVNSGLASPRGARTAETRYSAARQTQQQRLTDPLVWRNGTWQPTSWDDALDLVARVTARVIMEQGEDDLFVSMFDHGGSAGGYENTWATGKLYFESMKIRHCRIHNRPAYNSEVHASRDMGVGELNNCYEDAELADTLFIAGANSLETQTNYFLNHWVPNMRGSTLPHKRTELPDEDHAPARVVIVDPRRTVTVVASEFEAGAENVLHLKIKSGTDLVLFNALFSYIAEQGWVDHQFIDSHTMNFDDAVRDNRTSLDEASAITGVSVADLQKAAEWVAHPKAGSRRRTMFAYEKGVIWGNDNYRTNAALVNLALATGNVGRPGGGCVRLGGHQEGYVRPSDAFIGRPAPNVDDLLIRGRGQVHHIWACDHYKTTLNASEYKRVYNRRTNMVKEAMDAAAGGTREDLVDAIVASTAAGGLFSVNVDIIHSQIGQAAHVILPAAEAGEMNLTSMNGERRMRLTERYMDPPGRAKPDCLIAAALAKALRRAFERLGATNAAEKFFGYDWETEEDVFMDGYHQHAGGGQFVTYDRLRAMGNNGFQEPAIGVDGDTIQGTKRLYADGRFGTDDGRAVFKSTPWRGLQAPGKNVQRSRYRFLINNGRANVVWQSAFSDQDNEFVSDRFPYPFIEMNTVDMADLSVGQGDLVEIYNDAGATQAMAYPNASARRGETFMLFAYPSGPHGNVINNGVNELIIPNYKQTWANIRKLADAPESVRHTSFKATSREPR